MMVPKLALSLWLLVSLIPQGLFAVTDSPELSKLHAGQQISDFQVLNLYSDRDGAIVGIKLVYAPTGAPVYLLHIETVPQVYMWIDAPVTSNAGLPHALEHLLAGKGTKGRYCTLLTNMQLSVSTAATDQGFNIYEAASGTGMSGFYEQFHAWLDALYHPDFTEVEARTEFYHFGVATDAATGQHSLVEQGTVYNEQQAADGIWTYYYRLKKRVLGEHNPFGFNTSGDPDAMRNVTPQEIRAFHNAHYRLGPDTGFIFVLSQKEDTSVFLSKIAKEFSALPHSENPPVSLKPDPARPKYPITSASNTEPEIYPYPAESDSRPGDIRFAWKPSKAESLLELKLLQLLAYALGDGQKSILYRKIVDVRTREADFGATDVFSDPWLQESPYYPIVNIGISGVPGTRISRENITNLRSLILRKINEIKDYPDGSEALRSFNSLVESYAAAWRRDESVWTRNPPLFGYLGQESKWKQQFEYLEMDPAFVRSVTTEAVWNRVFEELTSGKNLWRPLIEKAGLLETPFASASVPSPALLRKRADEKGQRLQQETAKLIAEYHADGPQQALSILHEQQLKEVAVVQKIADQVLRPHFTDQPPMTPDDQARYRQTSIQGVPATETFFERPATIDVAVSFDLRRIPARYYQYLPIFPRMLDSLGLRSGKATTDYSALLKETEKHSYRFSIGYDSDANSKRAELTVQISALNPAELRKSLDLLDRMLAETDLSSANLSRIEDVIARQRSSDDNYTREEPMWPRNIATALRHGDDPLLFAMNSHFTRAHWDDRLFWLLHKPVSADELSVLSRQINDEIVSLHGMSREQIETRLTESPGTGLQREVLAYWKKNMQAFSGPELIDGLRQLGSEILDDLRRGPAAAIADLRQLQPLVFDRRALRLSIVLDKNSQSDVEAIIARFVQRISASARPIPVSESQGNLITKRLKKRYPSFGAEYPWHLALRDEGSSTGGAVFTARSLGYADVDQPSLIKLLASKRFAGAGLESFFMRTWEIGLAYNNGLLSSPRAQLLTYYADRSPDLAALVQFVNSIASQPATFQDGAEGDYVLSQTFAIPRSMLPFTDRGIALSRDIRDGASLEKVRRFSEAILALRRDPELTTKLSKAELKSICPVLLESQCEQDQQAAQSVFLFVGPDALLSGVEKRLGIPSLTRIWPSDFWLQ